MSDTPETDTQPIRFFKETKFNGLEEEMVAYVPKSAMEILERRLNRRDPLLVSVTKQRDETLLKLGDMIQEVGAQTLKRADAQRERDQWRECAERLAKSIAMAPLFPTNSMESAVAEFNRLRGEIK
jgi:hypothetical protein